LLYPPPNINFYDAQSHPGVTGMVALTIDDCFCRQGEDKSLMRPLRELFAKANNKATFFLTLCYSEGKWREREIQAFIAEGHELGTCQLHPVCTISLLLLLLLPTVLILRSSLLKPTIALKIVSTITIPPRALGATST
jgi:hypothetical protein